MTCSCGNTTDHKVAIRSTADGKYVEGWCHGNDMGAVCNRFQRYHWCREVPMSVVWAVLGRTPLHTHAEMEALVKDEVRKHKINQISP